MTQAVDITWLAERLPSPAAKDLSADLGQLIKHGEVGPGARLPPVRDLAAALGVSPATVSSAWQRLRARGVLVGGGRSGMRVAGAPTTPRPVRYQHEGDFGHGLRFDLKLSAPDPALLPDPMAALAALPPPADLNDYTRTRIVDSLDRAARAEWPYPARSLMTANGGYEALMLTLNTFIQPGDIVLVEDPATARMLDIIDLTGARSVYLERDDEGILPSALRTALSRRPTALVLQPSIHNAIGVVMSRQRRDELAAELSRSEMLIIEDDGFGPLVDPPIHALAATAPHQSVYIRSYSKSHGPDLRLAILEGPAAVIDRISDYRQYGAAWSSRILQECLAAMLSSPAVRRDVRRAAATYDRRRIRLETALRSRGLEFPAVRGMNLWIPVADERFAMVTLAAHGIAVMSGSRFGSSAATNHIRVSTSTLATSGVDEVADAVVRAAGGPGQR